MVIIDDVEYIEIFRPWITRGGKRIYAQSHGLTAWRMLIRRDKFRD